MSSDCIIRAGERLCQSQGKTKGRFDADFPFFVTGKLTVRGKCGKIALVYLYKRKDYSSMKKIVSPYGYREGFRDGVPIGLGYFSVSFGFGIMAVTSGLFPLEALIISITNLTSAGQVAGVEVLQGVLAAGGVGAATLIEMVLAQLVINMRYALMGVSLTQRLDDNMTTGKRLFFSTFITDENFAVSSSKPHPVGPRYFAGLITAPYLGWGLGTLFGAVAGDVLPLSVTNALGLALYAMFIAIILPPMQQEKGVLPCVLLAAGLSCLMTFVPVFSFLSGGFVIIISAVAAAVVLSIVHPVAEKEVQA